MDEVLSQSAKAFIMLLDKCAVTSPRTPIQL